MKLLGLASGRINRRLITLSVICSKLLHNTNATVVECRFFRNKVSTNCLLFKADVLSTIKLVPLSLNCHRKCCWYAKECQQCKCVHIATFRNILDYLIIRLSYKTVTIGPVYEKKFIYRWNKIFVQWLQQLTSNEITIMFFCMLFSIEKIKLEIDWSLCKLLSSIL